MQKSVLAMAGILACAMLGGCDQAKSPNTVANDVSNAQQKAAINVADAQKDASKEVATAAVKADDKAKDLNNAEVKGAYDVAMVKADGNHKIALEKCQALAGDAQRKCKDLADADYEAAKANLKATQVSQKQ